MPDWLNTTTAEGIPEDAIGLAMRLAMSLGFGLCVAAIFLASHGRERSHPAPLATTLVLLSMLIAMVSIVIGNSVARAFSLVGALSIVRFRTVVDDTRDTAFVIFAVIVGMAAGAGLYLVALVGVPVTGITAVALSHWTAARSATTPSRYHLSIRLALGLRTIPRRPRHDGVLAIVCAHRKLDGATRRSDRFFLRDKIAGRLGYGAAGDCIESGRRRDERGNAKDISS